MLRALVASRSVVGDDPFGFGVSGPTSAIDDPGSILATLDVTYEYEALAPVLLPASGLLLLLDLTIPVAGRRCARSNDRA